MLAIHSYLPGPLLKKLLNMHPVPENDYCAVCCVRSSFQIGKAWVNPGNSMDLLGLGSRCASLLVSDVETALHKTTSEMHSVALSGFLACA